jgi:phosphoribosylanthranilate isomerase
MPLRTLVKVGCITNLSDARYCAGMGVDLLGFRVVEGDDDYISPKSFQEIRGWVSGPQIVAEVYGIKTIEELALITEQYKPDYLEVSASELFTIGAAITLPFILHLPSGESMPVTSIEPAYILIDDQADHLEKVVPDFDVLIQVTSVEGVRKVIDKTGIAGVALNGGTELRPGLKSFDELREILEYLEADD